MRFTTVRTSLARARRSLRSLGSRGGGGGEGSAGSMGLNILGVAVIMMNKENSMGVENELSTEINDSLKSYSSRFRQLKASKSHVKNPTTLGQVLPYRQQRAALTIQRAWRRHSQLRNTLYHQLLQEIQEHNSLLLFENAALDQRITLAQLELAQLEAALREEAQQLSADKQAEASETARRLAMLSFRLVKKRVSEEEAEQMSLEAEGWRARAEVLKEEKAHLQGLLEGQVQEEQAHYLRLIREGSQQLLRASRAKNLAEQRMREQLVAVCRGDKVCDFQ